MFYSKEQINSINKRIKTNIIICSVIFLFVIGLIVTTCFFAKKSPSLFMVIDSIVLSVLCCYFTYLLLNIFIPNYRRKVVIKSILASNETIIEFDSFEVGKIRTINHSEKVYEISLISNNKTLVVFLDSNYLDKVDSLRCSHKVIVRFNYITEIIL